MGSLIRLSTARQLKLSHRGYTNRIFPALHTERIPTRSACHLHTRIRKMESIKHTIAENLGVAPTLSGDPYKLVDTQYQFELEQVGDLSGKVALVTGGKLRLVFLLRP